MKGKDGALDLTASDPFIVKELLNSTCINTRADTHVLYARYKKA